MSIMIIRLYLQALFDIARKVWRSPRTLRRLKTLSASERFVLAITAWLFGMYLKGYVISLFG